MKKSFDTEILSVGTELLLGHVTNTDARDISEMLSKIGINVKYHTVVGDNPERLRACVRIAKERADIIVTTGGLGPTCDDLTKQILAECFDLPLVKNEEEEAGLYEYIRTIAFLRVLIVDEWIVESVHVSRCFPNGRMHEDGGVDADHIVMQEGHALPPVSFDVVFEF